MLIVWCIITPYNSPLSLVWMVDGMSRVAVERGWLAGVPGVV